MARANDWAKTWTYFAGNWHEGNVRTMALRATAAWVRSLVFERAPSFEGVTPDVELRCAPVQKLETKLSLKTLVSMGNYSKLVRVSRIDDRSIPFCPLYPKPRKLYSVFAHS